MTPDRDSLERRWTELSTPTDDTLDGTPLDTGAGPLAYLAVDTTGARHLLLEVDGDVPEPAGLPRGLIVRPRRIAVADRPARAWLDLSCPDPAGHDAFTALAQELLEHLPVQVHDVAGHVSATLARWRWFWTAEPSRLINGGAVGLFGELWLLLKYLQPTPHALRSWRGPFNGRHDFVTPDISTEVKTTVGRGSAGPTHRIHGLEQLDDPESGVLHLFSLLLAHDTLATHSLTGLVEQLLATTAASVEATDLAIERLSASGWTPAHANDHRRTYRILAEQFYQVEGDFPRLTRSNFQRPVPQGIAEVSYSLAVAACTPWRIDPDTRHPG